jgi:HEPN domain-containing protein
LPRKTDSNNPADWLYFAESDLNGVRLLIDSRLSELLCESKLAECLEKVMKADLIRLGWSLVKTHDLHQLAEELRIHKSDLFNDFKPLCDALALRYFTDRYPGFDLADPDWPGMKEKCDSITDLVAKVRARIGPAKK